MPSNLVALARRQKIYCPIYWVTGSVHLAQDYQSFVKMQFGLYADPPSPHPPLTRAEIEPGIILCRKTRLFYLWRITCSALSPAGLQRFQIEAASGPFFTWKMRSSVEQCIQPQRPNAITPSQLRALKSIQAILNWTTTNYFWTNNSTCLLQFPESHHFLVTLQMNSGSNT